MEKETRNAIERATQRARRLLEDDFAAQLESTFDVLPSGAVAPAPGAHLSAREVKQRERIVAAIAHKRAAGMTAAEAAADYVRDAAFTTLNRFAALKMLEARGLVQECVSKGEQSSGYHEFCGMAPGVALLPDGAGYRLYVESLFDELSTEIKVLFDRRDPASVLWPRRATFTDLLDAFNAPELAGVWTDDETIGWVYQYFNSGDERKKMREASQAPRNSRELAVRNQFFTPRYVVEFLVDNTLGRTWLEMHGRDSRLAEQCRYFVRTEDDETRTRARKDPRDLRILDPACGSGHFLLYAFDLLLTIYEVAWAAADGPRSEATGRTVREDYRELDAFRLAVPALIVEHNLHGVDIDPRAAQIAALALWLRAQRAWKDLGVPAAQRPRISRTHIVVAEPMPGDEALVEEFAAQLNPPLLRDLFRRMVAEMRLAGELGTLLPVEQSLAAEVTRAREQFVKQRHSPQAGFLPGMERQPAQAKLDLSGIDDDRFFHEAECRLLDALREFAQGAASKAGGVAVRRRLFAGDAAQGIALIDLLRQSFDVVLMNPPFGAVSLGGKKEFEKAYPRTKNDVYAAFVERGVQVLHERGMLGAITSRTGFFLSSFQKWREEIILEKAPPVVFADLGYGVMDAAMVEAAAYCLIKGREVAA
jgi:23S rRNA G2445 N2-methylase RlmL